MKTFSRLVPTLCVFIFALALASRASAGSAQSSKEISRGVADTSLDVPPEIAFETAYVMGFAANPNSYEMAPQFLTGRVKWGAIRNPGFWHGYNQVYASLIAEPIVRGPENRYFGISAGLRYNFVQPGWLLVPYISGGVGLGFIDSTDVFAAQGEDFTFNILTAAGVSYQIDRHCKVNVGVLYQHFSNAGLTSPNPSLNAIGPQLGVTYSF